MDFNNALSFSELYKAANMCFRGILWKDTAINWKFKCLENLTKLRKRLLNGTYNLKDYDVFHITHPKPRRIHATKLVDRIVQRSLCNNGLYETMTKPLIYDNCACQVGKGPLFAIKRFKVHLSRYYRKTHSSDGYYLKLDIKNYFGSVPHDLLKKTITKYVSDENMKEQIFKVIDSYNQYFEYSEKYGHVGIGLGSQMCQLMMLLYLNDLDHYIKEKLRIKHYIRYMDDMILIHQDKEYLQKCLFEIKNIVEKYGLKLNKKSKIGKLSDGIEFLKIKFRIKKTGKIIYKLSRNSIRLELNKLTKLSKMFKEGKLSQRDFLVHLNSWSSYGKYRLSRKQYKIFNNHLEKLLC